MPNLIAVLIRVWLLLQGPHLSRYVCPKINDGKGFSRSVGVDLGDAYEARLTNDLSSGPLHVRSHSTPRQQFRTRERPGESAASASGSALGQHRHLRRALDVNTSISKAAGP